MQKQIRTSEWDNLDDAARQYHLDQWSKEKDSTRAFSEFIAGKLNASKTVVDLGCGAGACTNYLAIKAPAVQFSGVDLSRELIEMAQDFGADTQNLIFSQGDWFSLQPNFYDGAISLQTLSWLPEFEAPLEQIFTKIKPKWFAASSLFYEGDISARIEVNEHARGERKSFYNVYSLPAVARFCERFGYKLTKAEPFYIGIDLPKPTNLDAMGTYTRQSNGERLQISGPLLMPWHMILIESLSS